MPRNEILNDRRAVVSKADFNYFSEVVLSVDIKMIPNLPIYTEKVRMYTNSLMLTSIATTAFVAAAGNRFYHGHIKEGIAFTAMAIFDGIGIYVLQRGLRAELTKIDDFYKDLMGRLDKEHSKIRPGSIEDILLRLTADIPDTKPRE